MNEFTAIVAPPITLKSLSVNDRPPMMAVRFYHRFPTESERAAGKPEGPHDLEWPPGDYWDQLKEYEKVWMFVPPQFLESRGVTLERFACAYFAHLHEDWSKGMPPFSLGKIASHRGPGGGINVVVQ